MIQKPWYIRLRVRLIISFIAILLLLFCVGLIVWGSNSSSNEIALVFIAALSACFALGQWFFPLSTEKSEFPSLPYARELSRDSASFRMGDRSAANFDYITDPIKNIFDSTKKALIDMSVEASPKHGVLILGPANAGKSRLAFEALTQTLPDWRVLIWNESFDALPKIPSFTLPHGSGLVIFVDDLQEYVPSDNYKADALVVVSDNRLATLQAFLNNWQTAARLLIVATCRKEDETRVGARVGWLFDQLEVMMLPILTPGYNCQRCREELTHSQ